MDSAAFEIRVDRRGVCDDRQSIERSNWLAKNGFQLLDVAYAFPGKLAGPVSRLDQMVRVESAINWDPYY
jgi:hypothetical protein